MKTVDQALILLERLAKAQERTAEAMERMADAQETIMLRDERPDDVSETDTPG